MGDFQVRFSFVVDKKWSISDKVFIFVRTHRALIKSWTELLVFTKFQNVETNKEQYFVPICAAHPHPLCCLYRPPTFLLSTMKNRKR